MLAEVADDNLGTGFVPDEVDGHAYIGISATHRNMFSEEGRLTVIVESVTITVIAHDRFRNLRTV